MPKLSRLPAATLAVLLAASPAWAADIILSMNDNHTVLDDQANQVAADPVRPDTVDFIDISQDPPRIVGTIEVPGSVVGPPFAVWMAPDSSWAILTAATKAQSGAKFGIAPDDRVSVLDLTTTPPHVTQTLHAGAGATSIRLSPDGTLALVCNRTEGSVSVFSVHDKRVGAGGQDRLRRAVWGQRRRLHAGWQDRHRQPPVRQPGQRAAHRRHGRHRGQAPGHHGPGAPTRWT